MMQDAKQSFHFLLVEDNVESTNLPRELLSNQFYRHEFELSAVTTLNEALAYLQNGRVDVVILNLSISDSEQGDALLKLRSIQADVPIVLLSGFEMGNLIGQAFQEGTRDFSENNETPARLLAKSLLYALERDNAEGQRRIHKPGSLKPDQLRQAQKMEAIGRLTSGVVHDFNNILIVINGYSEMLMAEDCMPQSAREMLVEIYNAGKRAAALTERLLAFGRKSTAKARAVNLNTIIEDIESLILRLVGENVELVTRLEGDIGRVMADPSQIEQVLMNLAVNARDAMPTGGQLTIQTQAGEIGESHSREDLQSDPRKCVVLSISDNGMGMSEDMSLHIFEPFYTTKETGEGTGLGLATVYGIIQQSGGRISVHSEIGTGTMFKIYLPLIEFSDSLPGLEASTVGACSGSETVLLVEDDSSVCEFFKMALESRGYRVIESPSGRHALESARSYSGPIDIVLTDVIMPNMNGGELVEEIVKMRPNIKVLFMSGYTDDAVLNRGILNPQTSYLKKPFTSTSLFQAIRMALDSPQTERGQDSHQSTKSVSND